jgi:hypothetical protein
MARIVIIIVALAAIGTGMVELRHRQNAARAQMYRLEAARMETHRTLWDQQVKLGELASPQKSDQRSKEWPMDMVGPAGPSNDTLKVASKNR